MADVHARRRRNALAAVAGTSMLIGIVFGACSGPQAPKAPVAKPIEEPGGGRTILPGRTVVALYGLPGSDALGELGIGSTTTAGKKLIKQARPYQNRRAPVLPAMELISTLARNVPAERGTYSSRTSYTIIRRYLRAARKVHAILILDIQPGRGEFGPEIDYLTPFLKQPDVALALDPEWKVGPNDIPGQVIGSMDSSGINEAAAYLSSVVKRYKLPQKLLLVHRFTPGGIKHNAKIKRYPGVGLAINVDGFGTPVQKIAKYKELVKLNPKVAHGFKLFYHEDRQTPGSPLMTPAQARKLRPKASVFIYE